MRKKLGFHEYEIKPQPEGWGYTIFIQNNVCLQSGECFESYGDANLAAIGHISLIENRKIK